MAWWHRHQIPCWISPWQLNDRGNRIQWFQRWSDLNFWTSNYGAHDCDSHIKKNWRWSLWLHETYSKWTRACLAELTSTPLPQGQHIYIWTSQLQNVVQQYYYKCVCSEHSNSTGMLQYLYCVIIYIPSHYRFLGCDMCQCGWIQVSEKDMPTSSSGSKW